MKTTRHAFLALIVGASAAVLTGCNKSGSSKSEENVLRIGFFPNITHAQALVGYHESHTNGAEGWFEKRTGAKIEWYSFNAGPSAIEGLFAGTIDATYVGPNPPLNGYIRANGKDIRVLTGSARGGVALVVHPNSGLNTAADFRGKKIATPELGNTQDVAARAWLKAGGLNVTDTGGDAHVIPTANPDQLALFQRKEVDGVWTVEPWVSRLELEAGGKLLVEQNDAFITLLATNTKAINEKSELLKKFVAAHEELTERIASDPDFAKPAVNAALLRATTREIPRKLLDHAWPRLKFTTQLERKDFETAMRDASAAGVLPREADLTNLFVKP